jgi:hypothetical protein
MHPLLLYNKWNCGNPKLIYKEKKEEENVVLDN